MTSAQLAVFEYVAAELGSGRVAPSLREIASRLTRNSITAAHRRVSALVRDGYLIRTGDRQRNLALPGRRCPRCRHLLVEAPGR